MNYEDCDALCRRGGKASGEKVDARTIANNTRLIRIKPTLPGGPEHFHVKLHNTNILTFWANGQVRYDSGGWLTMTTKERMNRFGPDDLHVASDYAHRSGRWLVQQGPWHDLLGTPWPFVDDITFTPTDTGWAIVPGTGLQETERDREDRHNKQIAKLIKRYLDQMPPAGGMVNLGAQASVDSNNEPIPPCPLCLTVTGRPLRPRTTQHRLVGDEMGDVQHLIEHLIELHYHKGMFFAALTYCGYPDPVTIASIDRDNHFVRRALRKYLRARLTVGAVATAHGRRPIDAKPWNLAAAMAG